MQNLQIVVRLLGGENMNNWQKNIFMDIAAVEFRTCPSECLRVTINSLFVSSKTCILEVIDGLAAIFVAYPECQKNILDAIKSGYAECAMEKHDRFFGVTMSIRGILKGLSLVKTSGEVKEKALEFFAEVVTKDIYQVPDLGENSGLNGTLSNLVADFLREETPESLDFEKFLKPVLNYYGNLPLEKRDEWKGIKTFNARLVNEFMYKWFSNLSLNKKMIALAYISDWKGN